MVQDPHRYDDVPGVGDADLRHPNIRHPVSLLTHLNLESKLRS